MSGFQWNVGVEQRYLCHDALFLWSEQVHNGLWKMGAEPDSFLAFHQETIDPR